MVTIYDIYTSILLKKMTNQRIDQPPPHNYNYTGQDQLTDGVYVLNKYVLHIELDKTTLKDSIRKNLQTA